MSELKSESLCLDRGSGRPDWDNCSESTMLYPGKDSGRPDWDNYWQYIWVRVDEKWNNHDLCGALLLLITALFPFIEKFYEEFLMYGQSKIAKVVTDLLRLHNRIQEDFNAMKDASEERQKELAEDAIKAYYGDLDSEIVGFKNLLENNKGKMFDKELVTSLEQEFTGGAIFGPKINEPDLLEGKKNVLCKYWKEVWDTKIPDPDPAKEQGKSGSEEVVTNALNNVASTLSSQNSTVQAKQKYFEAQDEQTQAMIHNLGENFCAVGKHAISAAAQGR